MPRDRKTNFTRRTISLQEKVDILNRLQSGQGPAALGRVFGLNEATIRTIRKNEERIRKSVESGSPGTATKVTYARNELMEHMEKALLVWIRNYSKNIPALDENAIRHKAIQIFDQLKETGNYSIKVPEFYASKGWCKHFRERFKLNNINVPNEEQTFFKAEETSSSWEQMPMGSSYVGKSETAICVQDFVIQDVEEVIVEPTLVKEESVDVVNEPLRDSPTEAFEWGSDSNSATPNFTKKTLKDGFDIARKLQDYFLDNDPIMERSLKFQSEIEKCLAPYRELKKNLKK